MIEVATSINKTIFFSLKNSFGISKANSYSKRKLGKKNEPLPENSVLEDSINSDQKSVQF